MYGNTRRIFARVTKLGESVKYNETLYIVRLGERILKAILYDSRLLRVPLLDPRPVHSAYAYSPATTYAIALKTKRSVNYRARMLSPIIAPLNPHEILKRCFIRMCQPFYPSRLAFQVAMNFRETPPQINDPGGDSFPPCVLRSRGQDVAGVSGRKLLESGENNLQMPRFSRPWRRRLKRIPYKRRAFPQLFDRVQNEFSQLDGQVALRCFFCSYTFARIFGIN